MYTLEKKLYNFFIYADINNIKIKKTHYTQHFSGERITRKLK